MCSDNTDALIQGKCHCNKVGFELNRAPNYLVDCNCSMCTRLGALWGHIDESAFNRTGPGDTIEYMHGDRTLAVHSCRNCGCTTHWENRSEGTRMAVNFRMCEPDVVARFRIRQFDGAETWTFLDDGF